MYFKFLKIKAIFLTVLLLVIMGSSLCVCADESSRGDEIAMITYDIKQMGLTVGEATLVFNGLVKLEGENKILITFTAKALNFLDEEKIYLDPRSLYPHEVHRNLNIWGKKERIVERYETAKGRVNIIKTVGKHVTEQTIQKDGQLDNIYGFIYRYRQIGEFQIGEVMDLHLPTKDVRIKLLKETKLKVAHQQFDAYYMQSDLKKYKIWFDTSSARIPLRIDGAVGISKTSMVMKRHQ